jgi:phosphoribosyl-AMP cyclohydrolase
VALDFAVVPPGYRDDLLVCLGLAGRPTSAEEVHAAACRLATGVVELLGSHAGRFTGLPRPLAASLADGSLRRYLAQLVSNPSR